MTLPSAKPAILSLQFYAYPDAIGGAWKYTHEVNRRLVERGWPVHLITCKPDGSFKDTETIDGVTFHRLSATDARQFFRLGRRVNRAIKRIDEETRIGLVHVHNPLIGYLGLKNSLLDDAIKVIHIHSLWQDEERINRLGPEVLPGMFSPTWWRLQAIRYMEWCEFRRADSCLFLSEYMRQSFLDYFPFKKPRLRVIPGGVDIEHFRPLAPDQSAESLRDRLSLPVDQPVLLTVRRMEARMGLDRLIDAMKIVKDRKPEQPFKLIMIGKGSLREELIKRAQDLGLGESVLFPGEVSDDDLKAYYQMANVFILPTVELEGFGLSTVEALACGLPAIGTQVGGTVEILKPLDERLLFSGTSAECMAQRIEVFLEDPEPFRKLKPACRELVESRYGWEQVVDRIEEEFRLLLKR
ncbi:MAG: glycosyltransferase family 4 protein [Candidatus Nitronauta litoralis]|uniref:Glycosyltransferase family 4 protein n=1 Tax=Candidatus Nitronauta litoralis TaxID=2705533 RepID=A0A7T0FZF6_9BACT|nr:MAG: glycosyltransferase family 4 protein [Candidatus Nitronauta litoralis]